MYIIVNTIWYIDGSQDKINAKSDADHKIPTRFAKYTGYNDFKKKRKATPQLSSHELKQHADLVFRLSSSTYALSWAAFKEDLNGLSVCLHQYASYLDQNNTKQKFRQSLLHPARQVGDHAVVQPYPKCLGPVKLCYSMLDQVLSESEEYAPVLFDEYLHTHETFTSMSRIRYIEGLSLTHPVDVLSYDPGAGLGKVVFLWCVPENRSPVEMMSSAARIHKTLETKLPQYHTRQMRKEFVKTYTGMTDIPPHVMRAIYSDLTLDATACQNPAIEARLRHAVLTDDPDVAIDLRSLNPGRPNDTFNVFFDQLEKEVSFLTATDERRHGNVEHFSKYISVRDLIDQTSKKCPEETNIPSESTVLFAFVPKNAYVNTAKLFKGRINLQHKVQTRQLRQNHCDEHYCAAIFAYVKRYAVKFRDQSTLVCMDDKSKVDFGEPGMAVQTGVHGKKSLVPVSSVLGALDHDVSTKGSLTPSVCIEVDIPEKPEDSFYRGQVYVTLKDSVFLPSSPFRHAIELKELLMKDTRLQAKPYLLLYTDGGPDHRTTYAAVKLSLIVLFKLLDLDILIAARTAPGHSWANPAERIMSLLNLAYQNVALYRSEMSSNYEQMLKACGSMKEIRKKAEKEAGLEVAWLESVEQIVTLLNERTERVQLKGKSFKTGTPASKQDVAEFESKVKELVAPGITLGKYTQNDMKKVHGYKEFMEQHCREGHYVFQDLQITLKIIGDRVKKCDSQTCCTPVRNSSREIPPFLPDPEIDPENQDHYKSFEDVLGTSTSERDRPSWQTESVAKVAEQQQGCPNRALVAQNVRSTVNCYECRKPRCIYAKKALTVREERGLKRMLERYHYTCGSSITPDGDSLQGIVFVRLQLCCSSPVELPYYSAASQVVGRKDICCYCTEDGVKDEESLKTYRVLLPLCESCKNLGKKIIKRLPKKN
ncbi:uncharacterized protein LOC123531671 [Mercenaria mercenaria]|uniref:uncharacterized protein LOC123531671 n=1 Tax=Mercenaria mercenaria TaxID=6596 RepID=UPI00234F2291|nr:uncharacterized protein LOC123531671 [Mercenaria mercenaria]